MLSNVLHRALLRKPVARTVISAALASVYGVAPAFAQTSATPPSTTAPTKLEDIIVVGNPLDARDVVAPVSTLQGTNLLLKRASTLGETLDALPGVSQTWFGPNASRPVIRGLDGDRIKVLNNLGSSFDASNVSVDHNPAIDPLAIERIEVLRGPAALLYGGTAIGGVVNVVDNRIPHTITQGVSGAVETRFGGAAREQGNAAVMELGAGKFAAHLDAFSRDTDDYRVPSSTGVGADNGNRVVNSAAKGKGGAVGASYQFDKGHVGASFADFRSNYGTIAEESVRIDMKQTTSAMEANFNNLAGPITALFARFNRTQYEHVELDEGEPATRFKSDGDALRMEVKHARLGPFSGVIGLQADRFKFSALGDEAFVPRTRTKNDALFIFEEVANGAWKFTGGARVERSRVTSNGAEDEDSTRFGSGRTRTFTMGSVSAGTQFQINSGWSFVSNLALAERAPTFYELFANGPHAATGAYEEGNGSFGNERSTAIDAGVRWKMGESSARVGVFAQQFRNFIALKRTGRDRDAIGNVATDCGDGTSIESACTEELLPEFRYSQIKAQLTGIEADAKWRVIERPYTLDLEARADFTRAEDRTNNDALPRVAPFRVSLAALWQLGGFGARFEVQRVAKQNRVSRDDAIGATDGYTMINLAGTYGFEFGNVRGTAFVSGTNLGNRKAFNAASFDTIRALAPLPGRAVRAGVQVNF
jgi:iron complex outermembrane recepter protein